MTLLIIGIVLGVLGIIGVIGLLLTLSSGSLDAAERKREELRNGR